MRWHFIFDPHINTMSNQELIIIAIYETTKLKFRKVMWLAQGLTVNKWHSPGYNSDFLTYCIVQDDGPLLPLFFVSVLNGLSKCQRAWGPRIRGSEQPSTWMWAACCDWATALHCQGFSLCLSLFFLNWGVTHILYTWNAVVSSIHLSNIWHMYTLVCNYHPVQNIEISRSWYVSWYSRANMSVRAVYSVTIPLKSSVGLSSSKVVSSESLLPTEWITLELYVEEEDHMVQLTNEEVKLTANIYPVI